MKQLYFSLIYLLSFLPVSQAGSFSLKGNIHLDNTTGWSDHIFLLKINRLDDLFSGSMQNIVDSALIDAKGNFEFTNADVVEDNCLYRLNVVKGDNGGALYMIGTTENFAFFLLNKQSQILLTTEAPKVNNRLVLVKGDKPNSLIRKMEKLRVGENKLIDALVAKREALDHNAGYYKDSVNAINARLRKSGFTTGTYEQIKKFADTVSNPYVSLLAVNFLPDDTYADFLKKMNARYQKEIPGSPYTVQFNASINKTDALGTGAKAPAFSLPDANGRTISNADFLGKYVLIDFWASWCHPCREENKNAVRDVYNKYKDKGFAVISISQDTNRDNWLKAIEADGINIWTHLSDLKGPLSPVAGDYQVPWLPFNYLVDPNGVIIAKNLRGPDLEKAVAGLYH